MGKFLVRRDDEYLVQFITGLDGKVTPIYQKEFIMEAWWDEPAFTEELYGWGYFDPNWKFFGEKNGGIVPIDFEMGNGLMYGLFMNAFAVGHIWNIL